MYPFPPPTPFWHTLTGATWLFLTLILLTFGGVAGVLLRPRRAAQLHDIFIWFAAAIGLTTLIILLSSDVIRVRNIRNSFVMMAWVIAIFGSLITGYRLKNKDESKFTLVDFLVMLAIVAILIAICMPVHHAGFGEASRERCRENLHNLSLAFYRHLDEAGTFPPQVAVEPPASWRVHLLPYIEQNDLHGNYDFATEWNSPANLAIARQPVSDYTCPSVPKEFQERDGLRFTGYALAVGGDTIWPAGGPIGDRDIGDGMSHTLLLVEACGQQIVWTEPRDLEVDATPVGINLPGRANGQSQGIMSSYHPGGAFVTFADGSVRFLSEDTDPKVLEALLTADAGDEVGEF